MVSGCEDTLTVADPEADRPFESVIVKISVLRPFTGSVRLKVPVPKYGAVPPFADTAQLNGLPAVNVEAVD